jgi:regulator of cell morphogenesis and NO signaling
LTAIVAKVADVHRQGHTELQELNGAFAALRAELEPHMLKEEQVLFPAIRQLEAADGEASFPFGSVANPIRMMEQEHENAGDGLSTIRKITNDFAVPGDACNTYLAMLDGLRELETDLHQHIHKENNILFPRSLELESERCGV